MATVRSGPSPRAIATKPEMSANRTEASLKPSAIAVSGGFLQPLDDVVGEHVAQHLLRFRFGALGKAEGVVDRRRNEAERGDGALGVVGVEEGVVHLQQASDRWKLNQP